MSKSPPKPKPLQKLSTTSAAHKETGKEGERIAAAYLIAQGYVIREQNYRFGRLEMDLIVEKNKLLVFVEVKTRRGQSHGYPEEAVDEKKENNLHELAQEYLESANWTGDIRFDIVSIALGENPSIAHFEDAIVR